MYDVDAGFSVGWLIVSLALGILGIVAMWMIYQKAGQPGWAAIIPIYNVIVLLRVAGRPWWWLLLLLIPLVNIVVAVVVMLDLAKAFGHGTGFGLGLIFLSIIFYFTAVTSVVSPFPAGAGEIVHSISMWGGLFGVGLLTTLAQLLMTAGYTYCSASGGSIISLLGLPLSESQSMDSKRAARIFPASAVISLSAVGPSLRGGAPRGLPEDILKSPGLIPSRTLKA